MRLDKVLRLRGAVETDLRDAVAAAKRCAQCPFTALCDEALAAGDAKALALFCPNSHYVQRLKNKSLNFA
jgi:hypothetical protein